MLDFLFIDLVCGRFSIKSPEIGLFFQQKMILKVTKLIFFILSVIILNFFKNYDVTIRVSFPAIRLPVSVPVHRTRVTPTPSLTVGQNLI